MSSEELAKKIGYWTKAHKFCGKVQTRRVPDYYIISFVARTTKTRASSMVTRVKLIAEEVLGDVHCAIGKELISDPPEDRASLASWRIFVYIPVRKKRLEAA